MLNILKPAFILCIISAFLQISAYGQDSRPGSEAENMVLSAVSLMNENDIEGARSVLFKLLAQDADNDAAWYYLGMTSLMSQEVSEAEEYL